MCAFKASDGSAFTNHDAMKSHERKMGAKQPPAAPAAAPSDGEPMGEGAEQVAAQHGPATEVHITHQHETGQHHVHSMHPDGHESHSDHASAEEAHEHAKGLASGEHDPENLDELESAFGKFVDEEKTEGKGGAGY